MQIQISTDVFITDFSKVFSVCASHMSLRCTVEFGSDSIKDADEDSPSGGVAIAVKILQFYKREFAPAIPNHHVPFLPGNSIGIFYI